MNITRMTVTYGGTVNLGNYSNVKIEVTFEATLSEGEKHKEAQDQLFELAQGAYISEVEILAERNQDALNYLKSIAPAEAGLVEEKRKAALAAKWKKLEGSGN